MEEGRKYLGCLLYILEDPFQASALLAGLKYREDFPELHYTPRFPGNAPDEVVMKFYAAWCAAASDSRKCCFSYIVNTLEKRPENNAEQENRMYANAVKLCADVIRTVFQLARGKKTAFAKPCRLDELEPYEFLFGGFGASRFRSFVRDFALDLENRRIPLELDCGRFEHGISFGTHGEGNLRYWTAVLNESRRSLDLRVSNPEKEFGISFRPAAPYGVPVLGDPEFNYC